MRTRNSCVVHLSRRTDYSFRLLILLGTDADRTVPVSEVASRLELSSHHLAKIVQDLGRAEVVETVRGRTGGVRLTPTGLATSVGDVVRALEPLELVECSSPEANACRLTPACRLRSILRRSLDAFLAELDAHTVADLCARPAKLRRLLR